MTWKKEATTKFEAKARQILKEVREMGAYAEMRKDKKGIYTIYAQTDKNDEVHKY